MSHRTNPDESLSEKEPRHRDSDPSRPPDRSVGHVAFSSVYVENVDGIYGFLARRVAPHTAEELTAQTFAEAFAHRDQFDPDRGSISGWLFGIAINLVRRHFRSEERALRAFAKLAGRTPPATGLDEDAIASRILAGEQWDEVAKALNDLSPGERDVLLLYAWGDLPYASIAGVLDIPIGTVRSRLSRARARLSAAIELEPGEGPR